MGRIVVIQNTVEFSDKEVEVMHGIIKQRESIHFVDRDIKLSVILDKLASWERELKARGGKSKRKCIVDSFSSR